jgi:hypothetical protein
MDAKGDEDWFMRPLNPSWKKKTQLRISEDLKKHVDEKEMKN